MTRCIVLILAMEIRRFIRRNDARRVFQCRGVELEGGIGETIVSRIKVTGFSACADRAAEGALLETETAGSRDL